MRRWISALWAGGLKEATACIPTHNNRPHTAPIVRLVLLCSGAAVRHPRFVLVFLSTACSRSVLFRARRTSHRLLWSRHLSLHQAPFPVPPRRGYTHVAICVTKFPLKAAALLNRGLGCEMTSDNSRRLICFSDFRPCSVGLLAGCVRHRDCGFSARVERLGFKKLKDEMFGFNFDGTETVGPGTTRSVQPGAPTSISGQPAHNLDSACIECHNPSV
jgi:hypothetical protein